ncbi:MAG: NAD-dependent deacylase [Bacteroidales bacterium]|nr:NAD-dependent deacylase [Bacteroidales bacterium]
MKKLVVLTGAGISAESGFATFRDSGGLWETHPVERVATPEGWYQDPDFVNEFYNGLREQLVDAKPNRAHEILAELEKDYDVTVITQNVDDLHERAGSSKVIYLHGELMKACSSRDPQNPFHIVTLDREHLTIEPGTKAGDGSLLRPYIVWFGESVPNIEPAAEEVMQADVFVIVGTSLAVYPAAGLIHYCRRDIPIYLIDPKEVATPSGFNVTVIQDVATKGMARLVEMLKAEG